MTRSKTLWLLALLAGTLAAGAQWKKTPLQAPAQINPQLYRADANATDDINRALATAVKQHKRILLILAATGAWIATFSKMRFTSRASRLC